MPAGDNKKEEALPTPRAREVAQGLMQKISKYTSKKQEMFNEHPTWFTSMTPENLVDRHVQIIYKGADDLKAAYSGKVSHITKVKGVYIVKVGGIEVPHPLNTRNLEQLYRGQVVEINE